MLILLPVATFYGATAFAMEYYPNMKFAERGTFAGIMAAISCFIVMIIYIILAVREKVI